LNERSIERGSLVHDFLEPLAAAWQLVLSGDPTLFAIVWLSLSVSLTAVALASGLGLPLGAALAILRFPGQNTLVVIVNALMGLPPVVAGLFVYQLLSRSGPLGGLDLLFTPTAMVIAQVVLVTPIIAAIARQILEDLWREYGELYILDGVGRVGTACSLLWLGRFSLLTAVLAGLGRAAAEVGAILIVGGNIAGVTRTMTTAIALETSRGDLGLALGLGIVLLSLIVAINATAQFVRKWVQSLAASFLLVVAASAAVAQEPFITVASTTSTEESGLFGYLLPVFTKETGIQVHVVAVGTGQALKIGERGDCDVVFVHDRPAELAFVERGFGIDRREVMYNDFILVGPNSDPAHVDGGKDIVAAFRKIVEARAPFVARGDDSGTAKAEMRFWTAAAINPKTAGGDWYRDTGSGMGPTLNTAAAMDGYTLSDRGTWLSFKNKQNLKIVVEGDRRLFNQYGVMLVNPAKHPHVKQHLGREFIDWLTSPAGQHAIANYKISGAQLFFPDAKGAPS
jgi:tungstate transport system substrate-binding protein